MKINESNHQLAEHREMGSREIDEAFENNNQPQEIDEETKRRT